MIYTPDGPTFPEYEDLAERIQAGDGILWAGDPWMSLSVGVVTRGRRVVGHRLEVHRWCEDGEVRRIGTWHPSEAWQIPADLAKMRADRPGGGDVLARIDAHNDRMEREAEAAMADEMAQQVERDAYRLVRAQGHARTTFQVDGLRDAE